MSQISSVERYNVLLLHKNTQLNASNTLVTPRLCIFASVSLLSVISRTSGNTRLTFSNLTPISDWAMTSPVVKPVCYKCDTRSVRNTPQLKLWAVSIVDITAETVVNIWHKHTRRDIFFNFNRWLKLVCYMFIYVFNVSVSQDYRIARFKKWSKLVKSGLVLIEKNSKNVLYAFSETAPCYDCYSKQ